MPALAAPTELIINNSFDGQAHVYVDGRYEATVLGDQKLALRMRPGSHALEVVRPGGFVLASTRLMLNRGLSTELRVVAPMTDVRLFNPTSAPLRVDLGRHDDVWLSPGTGLTLPVRSGRHELISVVRERAGERIVERRSLWVEPGRPSTERLAWVSAPQLSRIVIVNHHARDMRVLVAGRDHGALRPGASLRLPLQPGRFDVQLIEVGGSVVFADRVSLGLGADTHISVQGRRDTRVSVIAHRPLPPPHASSRLGDRGGGRLAHPMVASAPRPLHR
jgi:hypothetical protein